MFFSSRCIAIGMDRKRSAIWEFFSKDSGSDCAKCLICKAGFKVKAGNTSNLRRHLECKHGSEFKKLKLESEAKPKTEVSAFRQETLPGIVKSIANKCSLLPATSTRAQKLTYNLAQMICVDYQPFSIVEDSGFRNFISVLDPRYELPTRHKLANEIIPKLFDEKKQLVKEKLHTSAASLCLTTDSWTSRASASYLSLTGHFIDDEMALKSLCLAVRHFPQHHTAENITSLVASIMEEYDIRPREKTIPIYTVTDNARNFTNAMRSPSLMAHHRTCFAHTLQLVVEDGLKEFKGLQHILSKGRAIVGHFKRSSNATEFLKQTQKQMGFLEHKLIQDVPTRWNSSFYMLERLVEQKSCVTYVLAEEDKMVNFLPNEWKTVKNLVDILRPFEAITKILSGSKYCSVSMVIPALQQLQKDLKDHKELNNLRDYYLKQIDVRWPKITEDSILNLATFLDPRFKLVCFSPNEREKIIDTVIQQILDKEKTNRKDEVASSVESTNSGEPSNQQETKKHKSFWNNFEEQVQKEYDTSVQTSNLALTLRSEVNSYVLTTPLELKKPNCPLKWWKQNAGTFPNISILARQYLSICATTVPSESLFSKAGITVSERRSALKESLVEKLVFLNMNWNLM